MTEPDSSTQWIVQPLGKQHDRAAFSCDEPELTAYIQTQARQHIERGIAAVFVATTPDDPSIRGFYTLSSFSIAADQLPSQIAQKLPRFPIPTTLLGRLARHTDAAGQRLGEFLLLHALRSALHQSKLIASYALVVHAKHDKAAAFYRRYGFQPIPGNPLHLFVPMSDIATLFANQAS